MKLLILAAVMTQQLDPWCADLQRLAAAPSEAVPFHTLRRADWRPRLFAGCFPTTGGYLCHRTLLPPDLTADTAAARVAACLMRTRIEVDASPWRTRRTVLSPTLRVRITESGTDMAHVGRMMEIRIMPAGWRQDSDG